MTDDASVLAEIARLSSAIEQHKHTGYPPTQSFGNRGGRGRGRGRGRGGFARGGAGGGASTTHRNATWVAPGLQTQSTATTPASTVAELVATRSNGASTPTEGMSKLVVGDGKGKEKEQTTPMLRPVQPVPGKPQAREVVIDGVVFVADARGNKLVRKPDADPSTASATAPPSPSLGTPKRTSHLGTTYIRTKTGNLVSLAFARKRKEQAEARKKVEEEMLAKGERLERLVGVIGGTQAARNAAAGGARGGRGRGRGRGRGGFGANSRRTKPPKPKSDKPCRYFQRTGQCSRAHTCPYVHDSTRISICPLFLRPSGCPRPAAQCPLSHTPNAHRSPHCSHFPSCTRPSCPYAHVSVSKDAGVCHEFAEFGWCPRGEECEMRHVRECWRFAETGKCEVKGCREPHVLRRTHEDGEEVEEDDEDEEEDDGEIEGEERSVLGGADEGVMDRVKQAGSKRKRRESTDPSSSAGPAGISGAAGRRLTKKLRQVAQRKEGYGGDVSFGDGDDFVELMVPLSDGEEDEEGSEEEEEEEEEGMSVDSEDLDEEDVDAEEQGEEEQEEEQHPPADLVKQVHLAKKDPPRQRTSSGISVQPDEDELDYGLSDDEDDALEIEQMLRR
ncbi:hypothetical protein JCM11251_001535 [Rhodosporidiobolus azoricus]